MSSVTSPAELSFRERQADEFHTEWVTAARERDALREALLDAANISFADDSEWLLRHKELIKIARQALASVGEKT